MMKYRNYRNLYNQPSCVKIIGIFMLLAFVSLVYGNKPVLAANATAPSVKKAPPSILSKCKADLAKRLKLETKDIKLADAQTVVWPSAALGMPETGKVYAQVQTPGNRFFLQAKNDMYLYTTSVKAFKYGGPLPLWGCSMLYVQSVKNEPNLNGDLYQCSLLGTNGIRLVSGVSDYYPQDKGSVIFKRRTSRSGHDLLYVKAEKPGKEKMLYQAMDFGAAAFSRDQDRWAGYVRPRLGSDWIVIVSSVDQQESKPLTIELPGGIRPGKIAWSGDTLMILVNKGDRTAAFEMTPNAGPATWKPVDAHTFPGQPDFMLNKSESLEIDQVKEDGKPVVEVARVWFTGDRNVVAKIAGLNLKGYDLLGAYAFIWGEKGGRNAAYTVNIHSGNSVVSFPGVGENIKPFIYPPHDSPVPKRPIMVD